MYQIVKHEWQFDWEPAVLSEGERPAAQSESGYVKLVTDLKNLYCRHLLGTIEPEAFLCEKAHLFMQLEKFSSARRGLWCEELVECDARNDVQTNGQAFEKCLT